MEFKKTCKILFLIVFNFWICFTANSQTIAQTLEFADEQFKQENYEIALQHYNRILFFDSEQDNSYIYNKIACIYYEQQNFDEAVKYYELSLNSCTNDSLKYEFIFKKVNCYIFQSKFLFALIDLYGISDTVPLHIKQRKDFYLGISFFGLNNFTSAEKYFINSLNPCCIEQKDAIHKLFESKKLNRPNPKLAFVFSIITPGMGQIYAGDIKNGVNSFLLTSFFISIAVYISIRYHPLDALNIIPWISRFYKGGIYNAQTIAERKLQYNRNMIFNKILIELEKCKLK